MSPVKRFRPGSVRKAVRIAGLPSATVTCRELCRATLVESPPPNCTTKVDGSFLMTKG